MYIVIELQKIDEETVGTVVNSYPAKPTAEQKYHQVLAAAAVSSIPCHSAVMMDEQGRMLKSEFYVHEVMPNE